MWDLSSETMGPVWPCRTRAVLEGLAHLATYEYIAAPLFKADDGYIVRHVPSFPVNDENWTRNAVKACADMVLTYVGEVEP